MERFIYIIVFLVVVLIFKAMFLDDYLKEQENENNVTVPVEVVQLEEAVHAEPLPPAPVQEKKVQASNKNEGMPIDQLGDSIANKLNDKL